MLQMKGGWRRFVESLILFALTCWYGAWFLMLAIGVVHHEVLSTVNPIGYWQALGLYVLVDFTVSAMRAEPDKVESR